jgi:hypothetical protein
MKNIQHTTRNTSLDPWIFRRNHKSTWLLGIVMAKQRVHPVRLRILKLLQECCVIYWQRLNYGIIQGATSNTQSWFVMFTLYSFDPSYISISVINVMIIHVVFFRRILRIISQNHGECFTSKCLPSSKTCCNVQTCSLRSNTLRTTCWSSRTFTVWSVESYDVYI